MADTSYPVVTGTDTSQSSKNIKLIDNGDNTYSQGVSVVNNGAVYQAVKDVTPLNIGNFYSFNIASGDFINFSRSSNGQQFTEVSMNPLSVGDEQTIIEYKTSFKIPCYAEIEASMSQRPKGQYAIMEITDKDASYLDNPIEYTFTSLSQSATTLTAIINAPFDGYLGSWVDIYGLADNRFNYTNLCVASISTDKLTLTFTVSDENTLTSLTASASVLTGGKLKRQAKLLLAGNALGMRFSGTSATATAYIARFGAGSIKESGTMTGATTNATSLKTTAGNLYALAVSNMSASTIYLKLYNKASAPTVGTDIPILTIPIVANSFYVQELGRTGIRFTTGIAYAITAALADTDTTVITAGNKLVISYI